MSETSPNLLAMDVVYCLGTGSLWQDREILFSLRSLRDFVPDVEQVVVVGQRPAWLRDVRHVPAADPHHCKERNIMEKVLRACGTLTRPFLFMNDDHFALRPQRAAELPNWYAGTVEGLGQRLATASHYRQALLNTAEALGKHGYPTRNFDIHVPIVYDPAEFRRVMAAYDWAGTPRGFVVKSLYANTLGLPPTHLGDVKIGHACTNQRLVELLRGRPWFSIGPAALTTSVQEFFSALYPTPSPWENR